MLETTFHTDSGSLVLTDLMPVASEEEKRGQLLPDHEVLRLVECVEGEVEIELVCEPRPRFGLERPRARVAGRLGARMETSAGLLVLRADLPLTADDRGVRARARLRAGESRHVSLTLADDWPAVLPVLGDASRAALDRSVAWWRSWASKISYDGPGREAVIRSALVLKLLVYAPSGAVVAAPTTSLPERVGGDLNWDYRFCWLRDASLTVRALFGLGCPDEATAFLGWLLHSTRLTQPEMQILYDVHGNLPVAERCLDHLAGHRGSRPVRVGNAATEQLQLDVYGELIDAAHQLAGHGGEFDRETQRLLRRVGEYVCRSWSRPDEGIWEPRSGRRHHTHSRVLCWVALDRLLDMHASGLLRGAPVERFSAHRDLIRREIEARAWNPHLHSYVSLLDGDEVDASLLLLPWYGFEEASSARMQGTWDRIRERLEVCGSGLLHRYRDGDSPGEGAFGVCSFWGVELLALGGGPLDEALERFERLCGYANDVGLFAEEIDPTTGEALGNFPQAFTHIGLINAALSLAERQKGIEPEPRPSGRVMARRHEAHP